MTRNNEKNWRNLFLGREKELNWLEEAWKKIHLDGPQMRVLTAESGYGKTKIAHQFYRLLSSKYDPDGYWPKYLSFRDQNLEVMPDMTDVQQGKKIPWFWWGERWLNPKKSNSPKNHSPFLSTHSDPNFRRHQKSLLCAVNARKALLKASASIGKAVLNLFSGASSITELASALSDFHKVWKIGDEHFKHRDSIKSVEKSEQESIQEVCNDFEQLLHAKKGIKGSLPVVLFIDDAHWIDPISLRTIQKLWENAVKSKWPLMILATHWQVEWNENIKTKSALGEDASQPHTFAQFVWRLQHIEDSSSERIKIKKLERLNEVRELLTCAFPGLESVQADFFSKAAKGNPRHIAEIIVKLEREKEWFEDEDFTKKLNENWVDISSQQLDLKTLENERFYRAEKDIRKILGAASLQGNQFLKEFTLEVAVRLSISTPSNGKSAEDPLHVAENPYELVMTLNDECSTAMEFRSDNIYDSANKYFKSHFKTTDVEYVAVKILREWIKESKLAKIPLRYQLSLLKLGIDKAKDHSEKTLFLSVALYQIQESGCLLYANEWINSWEELKPTAEDFQSCDFGTLCCNAFFFHHTGYAQLGQSLMIELEKLLESRENREDENSIRERFIFYVFITDILKLSGHIQMALENLIKSLLISDQFPKNSIHSDLVSGLLRGIGDLELELGQTQSALERYHKSLALSKQLREEFGDSPERLEDFAASIQRIADVENELGETQTALERYLECLAICEQLRELGGDTPKFLEMSSICLQQTADIEFSLGHTQSALQRYQKCLEHREQLLKQFGASPERLGLVATSIQRIADVEAQLGGAQSALERYHESLALEDQIREQSGESSENLRRICVLLQRIADMERKLGETQCALERYHKSLALCEQIREQFGETPQRIRDIKVILDNIANVELELGQTQSALERYHKSLALSEQLREQFGDSPERLSDIAVSIQLIANVELQLGKTQSALDRYHESLALAEQIREKFGDSPERLRHIAVLMADLADVELKLGNTPQHRTLNAMAALFDVELKMGNTESALSRYIKSLALFEQLRDQFGDSPERLRDIAIMLNRVAKLELQLGQKQSALERYGRNLTLREQLRAQLGDSPERLHALAFAHYNLTNILRNDPETIDSARNHAEKALAFVEQIIKEHQNTSNFLKLKTKLQKVIAELSKDS